MALTATQRRRLPRSAFAIPSRRAYPIPTKAQARRAGISEPPTGTDCAQRPRPLRPTTDLEHSYKRIAPMARKRAGAQVRSVSRSAGTVTRPGYRRGH